MHIQRNVILEGQHGNPIITDVFYRADHLPKPVVIFCHGYKSFKDWGPFNKIAERFANEGFVFVKFNFSHNGGTIDQVMDFPDPEAFSKNNYCIELDDLQSVLDWCIFDETIPTVEKKLSRISLFGHSRGGGIAILKAAESKQLYKLVTLAAVGSFGKRILHGNQAEEWKRKGVIFVENKRTKQQLPHLYQFYENFMENRERLDVPTAEKKLRIPHLIIHGTSDETIPFSDGVDLSKLNPLTELFPIEDTGHTFGTKHPWEDNPFPAPMEKALQKAIDFLTD